MLKGWFIVVNHWNFANYVSYDKRL